ncbi:YihY/virulence factor BrkB family protein [Isachenkonia alkalipeptolytica]|uniref:YihY/virulence factor BrkB family protein n=1 Tax=Isachenkonia alkalipeptolytica TaxID=2565777 RepID=A0AA43XI33_9CLOT|nr:YihY/virulence factor BrkB family protein [Isachenkonia alkalipeptolytica]NBG86977.1 YihY/virulence factor BrkB family protein [Isachenkonia alkalipeptolytica]
MNIDNKKLNKWKSLVLHLKQQFKKNELKALGAQLSYYLILSFFPFLIVLIVLLNFTPLTEGQTISQLAYILPDEVFQLTLEILDEIRNGLNAPLLSVSSLATIWAASKGTSALIKGLNKAYQVSENRSFFRLRAMGVVFTFGLAFIIIFSLFFLVFGRLVGLAISEYLGFTRAFLSLWEYLRYGIPLLVLFFIFTLLFRIGPNYPLGFKDVYPGAIFTTLGWIIISLIFSFYVNNYGAFSRLYGSIGAVIALLIWLNISSLIVLIGGEINATRLWYRSSSSTEPSPIEDESK